MAHPRLLAVFEAVAAGQPVTLAEVASACALPTSSVHRALGTLAGAGWIRPVAPGRPRWIVTERVRAIVAGPSADLVARARDVVAGLATATGETAVLWLADGDAVVAAAVGAPATALRVVVAEGTRTPAHACAAGKVVLAARTDAEVRVGAAGGLAPLTVRTVGDAEQLLVDLRRVRIDGVASARDEEADGVTSIAAPAPGGAVGIVGPTSRLDPGTSAPTVLAAARSLTAPR